MISVAFVKGLYLRRGYPEKLVEKWTSECIEENWINRMSVKPVEGDTPLDLKSYYNKAWNYFNVQKLDLAIKSY